MPTRKQRRNNTAKTVKLYYVLPMQTSKIAFIPVKQTACNYIL